MQAGAGFQQSAREKDHSKNCKSLSQEAVRTEAWSKGGFKP